MKKMDKKDTMRSIYKSIDRSLKKIIDKKARTYLKTLKNKPWHRLALKEYTRLTMDMLGLLKRYSKLYSSMLKDKEIVLKSKKKLSKKELEKIIEETSDKFKDDLEKFYQEKINKDIIINSALLAAKDSGIALNINILDEFTRDYLKDKKINWAKQVAETTEKRIKEILVKGFEEGLGSYDIAELIYNDNVFSYNRAEAIARTEIIGACNYADYTIYQIDDDVYAKKWSATGDERTREAHSIADGQIVLKDKPFIVGGEKMMYPLDGSLGASAGNIINCRCTMLTLTKEEYEKEMNVRR